MGVFDGDIFSDCFDLDDDGVISPEDRLFSGMMVDDLLRETENGRDEFDDSFDDFDDGDF